MCGIVGYIGRNDALAAVVNGLEKLEYRGYDSAGVSIVRAGVIETFRAPGKLIQLKKILAEHVTSEISNIAIGHTRWATHGRPSENNAHPHSVGRVSLIHNGIIENYIELKQQLQESGAHFSSETDTEIAAHLLNRFLMEGLDPLDALYKTCLEICGSYALVAIDSKHADRLLVAKSATPIVIGIGDGEVIVASDIPAVLSHTRQVVILEDGDIAEVRVDGLRVINQGQEVKRDVSVITWDPVTAQKGGYKHFMLKEIHEQVSVLAEAFRGRIKLEDGQVFLPEIGLSEKDIEKIRRIVLVACGTAWHACLEAKFFLESLAKIPCEVDYASEFRYRSPLYDADTLVIAVSQSGETADTLAAMELVGDLPMRLAICNVLGSSLARRTEHVIFTQAGPEMSVASTKAFTTQLVTVYLLALFLGQRRGNLPTSIVSQMMNDLMALPGAVADALKVEEQIKLVARSFHAAHDFLYIARGMCYPIALEGALKLKEISYVHAEGYPAGEMKHGPIALIDENMPVVVVLQRSAKLFDKVVSNLREVESRGGKIIVVTDVLDNVELRRISDAVIEVPYVSEYMSPMILTIPLQLLAYYVAVFNGTDVDLPRNLAKSVTVE